jgi:hypothetical protein
MIRETTTCRNCCVWPALEGGNYCEACEQNWITTRNGDVVTSRSSDGDMVFRRLLKPVVIKEAMEPMTRKLRIRRCNGNRDAWCLVTIQQNGEEADSFGSYTTAMSIDGLLKSHDARHLLAGNPAIELVLS